MLLVGNIGEGCEVNTEISLRLKTLNHRNAYQLKLAREYNTGKSVHHLEQVKMYAELKRKKKLKKLGIKSLNGNKLMGFCSIDQALGFDGSDTYLGVSRDRSPILRGDIYDLTESNQATIVKDLLQVFYRRAEDCSSENMELLVPYALFAILVREFEYSKERDGKAKDAVVGYRTIRFCTPEGEVRVTPVAKMREDKAYIIDWSTFMILGDMSYKMPHQPSTQPEWYRERGCSYLFYKDIYLNQKLVNTMPCKNACVRLDPAKYLACE